MKKTILKYWGIILIPLFVLACAKEEIEIDSTVSAKINGIDWSKDDLLLSSGYKTSDLKMRQTLTLQAYLEPGDGSIGFAEALWFVHIDLNSLGKQKVNYHPADMSPDNTSELFVHFTMIDYDLVLREYDILEMEGIDNWIQLDEIGKDRIKGRFEVALKVAVGATNWVPADRLDTLYFTEGVFEALRSR